jgi:hypothetical protein
MTAKCRTAPIAAKALLRSLRAHRALTDDADFSVILLEASGAAEGVARLVGFALELATAARVAAAAADKSSGVDFERIGGHIHDAFLTFQVRDA